MRFLYVSYSREGYGSSESDLDQSETIRVPLMALPEEQHHVVAPRHLVGVTPGKIADRMGRSEGSTHGLYPQADEPSSVSYRDSSPPHSRASRRLTAA